MHCNTKRLYGRKLEAVDGEIGFLTDIIFDDVSWAIRHLVVDTGSWLSERRVLLAPHVFEPRCFDSPDRASQPARVNITRRQIEESPSAGSALPVSQQREAGERRASGAQDFWQDPGTWGVVESPSLAMRRQSVPAALHVHSPEDVHRRSTKAVTGHHIEATDGPIGVVDSFVINDLTWVICELVVEAGHWYAGKKIILLPENVRRIDHDVSTVFINLTKKDLQDTRENDIAQADAGSA